MYNTNISLLHPTATNVCTESTCIEWSLVTCLIKENYFPQTNYYCIQCDLFLSNNNLIYSLSLGMILIWTINIELRPWNREDICVIVSSTKTAGLPWCINLWYLSLFWYVMLWFSYYLMFSGALVFNLFYVVHEFDCFLHKGWAKNVY